jgi:hypothetical protein
LKQLEVAQHQGHLGLSGRTPAFRKMG